MTLLQRRYLKSAIGVTCGLLVAVAIIVFQILWLSLAFSGQVGANPPLPLHDEPGALPDIAFADEAGRPQTLQNWGGKVVLLNIWATWCGPCRAEMPTLDRLQAKLGGDDFEVVALSIDRAGPGVVRKFFSEIGVNNLRIFIDQTMKASADLKVLGLPSTLLLGPDGQELGRLIGPAEWDAPDMIAFLRSVITKSQKGNLDVHQ